MQKIKVLCVDDSALIRSLMTEIINSQPDMTVVATAPDPLVARDLIKQHNPDVLTLDVEMPRMDGLDFLEKLMRLRPMPVVMVSSLTERGNEITLRALELGAVDFVTKPKVGIRDGMLDYAEKLADKVRAAARARVRQAAPAQHAGTQAGHAAAGAHAAPAPNFNNPLLSTEKLIIVGASTGGTEAIREVLVPLPPDAPAVLIAQHMPPGLQNLSHNALMVCVGLPLKRQSTANACCRVTLISHPATLTCCLHVAVRTILHTCPTTRR